MIVSSLTRRFARAGQTAPRVLVIDDDATIRALVRIALSGQGWEVLEADGPDEGFARARRELPDVVLLDVNFSGSARDGFAVCRDLRSLPATRRLPIVLFTAQDDPESRAFAGAVGATAYLVKPFAPDDLLRMLRLVQGQHGGRPALGLYLIEAGIISPAQLEQALAEQRKGKKMRLGEILIELGVASPEAVQIALAQQHRARRATRAARHHADLRVVIADDHSGVREGLRSAIAGEEGMSVVGVAIDGDEALSQIRTLRPDVVVLDNDMPKRSGIEVLRAIHADMPQVAVVLFTLDDSVGNTALASGASAVITKDSPIGVLVAEMRRAAAARPERSPAGVGAAQSIARMASGVLPRDQRALVVVAAMSVSYAAGFLVLEPVLGASAAGLQLIPVVTAGALFGPEAGIGAAVLSAVLTAVLWQVTGHPMGAPILTIGGNWLGVLALMGLGAGFGVMRVLRGRLDRDARRAGSLAEAAGMLTSGGGPEMLRLLARGALEVVPGDAVLLFLAVPGGGLELVAAPGAPSDSVGSRRVGDAVTRVFDQGRADIVDASAASIGIEIPRMRRALVIPLTVGAGGPRGVIAVLAARRDALREEHVQPLLTYAAFVDMAMAMQLRTVETADATDGHRATLR